MATQARAAGERPHTAYPPLTALQVAADPLLAAGVDAEGVGGKVVLVGGAAAHEAVGEEARPKRPAGERAAAPGHLSAAQQRRRRRPALWCL